MHLPWCIRKCPYCDFNSHAAPESIPFEAYGRALIGDLDQQREQVAGRPLTSIYFGGGTPSLFPARYLERLLRAIEMRLATVADVEVTLEANPGTVEHDAFAAYRDAGVNRVSLGVQSFSDRCLRAIGRIHGRAEVESAIESLHRAGLGNFNLDLMYGLPGQTPHGALRDLERAVAAQPAHISWYQLTIEPNTLFAARPPRLPGEEALEAMHRDAGQLLADHGYDNYEISAWSRAGLRCRHNLNYWRYGDYLGIGAGAHGKVTHASRGRIYRYSCQRHPRAYLQGRWRAEQRELDGAERVFEYFLNRLRLRECFTPGDFAARTGLGWENVAHRVQRAKQDGLLEVRRGGFRTTAFGRRFLNDAQAMFLP